MKNFESYVVTQGIPRSKAYWKAQKIAHTSSRDDIELRLNWAVILNVCMSLVRTIYRIYTACAYIYIYIHIFIHSKYIIYISWMAQEIFVKRNMWTTFFPNHHFNFLVVDSISSFWKHMKAPKFSMPRSFQTNFKPSRFRGMVYRLQIQHGTWKWWGIWFFFPPY